MEDKLENLQALIEGSGLGDVRQKVRGMSEARVLWVLDGYKVDGLPSGREFSSNGIRWSMCKTS